MGEAAESDEWLIDQAVAEYEAYCAGELRPHVEIRAFPNGELQFCGRLEERARWTICFVHAAGQAVTPLAVGSLDQALAAFVKLDRSGARFEDPRLFPPPSVRVGGVRYRFQPVQGLSLVGVVQLGKAAVLLAALGDRVAVVYVEGRSRVVLDVKAPLGLREVDVDRMLGFHRPHSTGAKERRAGGSAEAPVEAPIAPAPAIQAHHIRIVRGVPVDVGGGPSISEVLQGCFEDILRRVKALKKPGQKLKGKTKLRAVLGVLLRLGLHGCGDLVGLCGEIIAEIKEYVPEFEITAEAFADVLNLMRKAKSCLVERDEKERTWRINLAGLGDPRSALHVRLCKETTGCLRIHEVVANQRPDAGGPGLRGGLGSRERRDDSHGASCSRLRASAGTTAAGAAEQTSRTPERPVGGEVRGQAADETTPIRAHARDPGGGSVDELVAGVPAGAAPHGPKDRSSSAGAVGCSSAASSVDPAAAALGQLAGASPVLLLAAMVAVAQARREAEEARIVERAEWEAERRALTTQLDAVARERADLVVLLHQLAGLTVGQAPRLVPIEWGVAGEMRETAEGPGAGGETAGADRGGEVDLADCSPVLRELTQHGSLPAGTTTVPATNQVVEVEPLLARQADVQAQAEPAAHRPMGRPTLDRGEVDGRAVPGTSRTLRRQRPDARSAAEFNDPCIDRAGPATLTRVIAGGSLGPRGPPGSWRYKPSRPRSRESMRREAVSARRRAARSGWAGPQAKGQSMLLYLHETTSARYKVVMPQLVLEDFNLAAAERRLCVAALEQAGNIVGAAQLLGITRHAMKRRIVKLRIAWPRTTPQVQAASLSISPGA